MWGFFAISPNLYLPPVLPCKGVSAARGEAANTDCGSYGAFAKSLAMCVMQRKVFSSPNRVLWRSQLNLGVSAWRWLSPRRGSTGDTSEDGNLICLTEKNKMLQLQGIYSRSFLEATGKGFKVRAHQGAASKMSLFL